MILSNEINGYNFDDIVENTVKANESFHFDDVTFKEQVNSLKPITLLGDIPGLDLENVITSAPEEQVLSNVTFNNDVEVTGNVVFAGLVNGMNYTDNDVEVTGNVVFAGLVNGMNYTDLCSFSHPYDAEPPKNLIITENTSFLNGPSVVQFQNMSLDELYEDVWLANREMNIEGHIEFETINFENNVTVLGLVDHVNLTWLTSNYFSKTKYQEIPAHLDFTEGINFLNGVSASEMQLKGLVSGLNITEFLRTTILNDVEQIFDDTIDADSCTIQNLDDWIHRAVLKYGGIARGKCIFHRETDFSKGIGVVTKVNGITFNKNNIMMKKERQLVAGKKIIQSNIIGKFQDIILNGTLNGVEIMKLFQNQVLNGTLNGVEIMKLFQNQADKNLTNLITTEDLNNYYENYGQLLNVANKIKESLNHRAFSLDHYNDIQYFENVFDVFHLVYQGEPHLLMVNDLRNKIELYRWNDLEQKFENRLEPISLENLGTITYLSILNTAKEQYIYFEHRPTQNSGDFVGTFTVLNDTNVVMKKLSTNGTRFIHSTLLLDKLQTCFIFTYISDRHIDIYCESDSEEWISIHQQLDTYTTLELVTFTIGPIIYIVTVEDKNEDHQNCILLWKFDINTRLFNKHQTLYIMAPTSVSVATYNNIQYLAISSSCLEDAQYKGSIEIYRFNTSVENFVHWGSLLVETPKQLQFVILPSNEFIFYILTANYINPLQIYIYEGVSGFKQNHLFGTTLSSVNKIKNFNIHNENFLLAWNQKGVILLQAYFRV
ncbi:hypothetical protein QE152_g13335 [Popillia japonica]|uniref:Uncharacterized protein n=1 Tax=Popillia japonica TaxID=7064 RepID=A0AAW1LDM2_POPJA